MVSHVAQLITQQPDWLDVLTNDFKIHVVRDEDLVSLKYNQIESPMAEPIVQECRGMVVDTTHGKILAHPYNKFWNHGEHLAAPIDWGTARVQDKADGSLMILYWHNDAWQVASSGTPRAGGTFGDTGETFRDAFWRTFDALGMKRPGSHVRNFTFMFEFCDAPNRIVVRHERPRIILHGARDLRSGQEFSGGALQYIAETCNWEQIAEFPIASIDECLAAAEKLDPIAAEGFVVVDWDFNRVKIKSPRYVILHHMKDEATLRRAIELWQTGEAGELLTHFPEMSGAILPVHERLDALAVEALRLTNEHEHLSRKYFAEHVKATAVAPIAFRLYGKQTGLADALAVMRACTTQALERMLEREP